MRRSISVFVFIVLGLVYTSITSYAERNASAVSRKQEVRAADSSKTSPGFAAGDSSSSGDETNLSLTANKHRPRIHKDPRGGRRLAVECCIQERG
jgi:hypothetical protein